MSDPSSSSASASSSRPMIPSLAASLITELQAPPSPRTHRALRRLQSAHTLGARANNPPSINPPPLNPPSLNPPSLISQQRQREQHRNVSPTRLAAPGQGTLAPAAPVHRSPTRGRANSDATPPLIHQMNVVTASKRAGAKKPVFSHGHMSLQQIIREGPTDGDFLGALESARWKVIDGGVKSAEDGMSTLRIYVWMVLLDAPILSTDDYLALIHRGASPAYSKIRNDTFRTLTTDPLFRRRVSEASLIRLLNAIAWRLHDSREEKRQSRPGSSRASISSQSHTSASSPTARSRARALTLTTEGSESGAGASGPESGTYVQGMNVLAAPFLYAARSEAEAFVAFHSLLTRECPGYIRGAMDGVHRGLALVDKVLAIVDPKLSMYLTAKGLSAEIYAFPSVLTLCACTPPLPEVLRLWDFLFAYGPHLNIVCIVAQLTIMRSQILQSPSPNKVLRSFPQLNADLVKSVTIGIIKKIPDDVYSEIVSHAL
ncbi:rab-GTPase-TBC domain-containing protein [Dactylonectria estremocensis]|uniref:Rab-GTPase-TBC domain-containing protein n=1 Tax=Dactylonectria estremocensis TaxID=1079267 RepID=A0A9P9FKS8_9HYPO|nr:rab-GTPase-TBC domain-containing protein [Dactylonectria estremocensis]